MAPEAAEVPLRKALIKKVEERKTELHRLKKVAENARAILDHMIPIQSLLAPQLKQLLLWYKVEDQGSKPLNKIEWEKIVAAGTPPPTAEEWSPNDEAELESLKDFSTITMGDTSYGRLVAGKKRELLAGAAKMNAVERAEVMAEWAKGNELPLPEEEVVGEEDGDDGPI